MINNKKYVKKINEICDLNYDFNEFKGKTFLVVGATGLIGTFLIDVLMNLNNKLKLNCNIIAVCRNVNKAEDRFSKYLNYKNFKIYSIDINQKIDIEDSIDYIIHGASNTHPLAYSNDPIGTITTNVIGTYNLLNLAVQKKISKFIFLSSVEIYGENNTDKKEFSETDLGYLNCNTLRAGYPESKRLGEALCQAYIKESDLDITVARLPRVYGPTILKDDSKALSQFINKAINNENIILKSEGKQFYSYGYVGDIVSSILFLILNGETGEAYNVSSPKSDITLKDLANLISNYVGKQVVFELPSEQERKGYSTATTAILDSSKIRNLGWTDITPIEEGIKNTIDILKKENNEKINNSSI